MSAPGQAEALNCRGQCPWAAGDSFLTETLGVDLLFLLSSGGDLLAPLIVSLVLRACHRVGPSQEPALEGAPVLFSYFLY